MRIRKSTDINTQYKMCPSLDSWEKRIYQVLEWSTITFLLIQVFVIVVVVFGRFILNRTPRWGEEVALLNMVYLATFSAIIAEIDDQHIKVNLIDKLFSTTVKRIRNFLFNVFNACLSLFLVIEGLKLAILLKKSIMPGSRMPMTILYLSVPIANAILFFVIIKKIIRREV